VRSRWRSPHAGRGRRGAPGFGGSSGEHRRQAHLVDVFRACALTWLPRGWRVGRRAGRDRRSGPHRDRQAFDKAAGDSASQNAVMMTSAGEQAGRRGRRAEYSTGMRPARRARLRYAAEAAAQALAWAARPVGPPACAPDRSDAGCAEDAGCCGGWFCALVVAGAAGSAKLAAMPVAARRAQGGLGFHLGSAAECSVLPRRFMAALRFSRARLAAAHHLPLFLAVAL